MSTTEYKLSYTAAEINNKLAKVDENATSISKLSGEITHLDTDVFALNTDLMEDSEPVEKTIKTTISSIATDETHYAKSNGIGVVVGFNADNTRYCQKFPVKENETYIITGIYIDNDWGSLCVFVDANNKVISEWHSPVAEWQNAPVELTAPVGAVHVYVNGGNSANVSKPNTAPKVVELTRYLKTKSFKYKDDIERVIADNRRMSYIDKNIKYLESETVVVSAFENANSIGDNCSFTCESLYSKKGVMANSLTNNAYLCEISTNFSLKADKKYYLVFKTDRAELMATKALKLKFFNSKNELLYEKPTDYSFSYALTNGWNTYEFVVPNDIDVSKIYISLSNVSADNIPNIVWDGVIAERKIKPFVFYCTDNGTTNVYDKIAPILLANKMRGCTSLADTNMTDTQIQALIEKGWDFAIYAMNNYSAVSDWNTYVSNPENLGGLTNGIKELIDINIEKNVFPHAYFCKSNYSTPTLLKAVKANNISMVRTSSNTGLFGFYTVKDMEIPTIGLTDTNLETVKAKIDYAVENGFGICVFTHQVVDGGDPSGLNVGTDIFTEFCKHCKSYIDRGELQSFNAKDVIDYFSNGNVSPCDIDELKYLMKNTNNS